jgi:hypothetical protein
MRAVEMPGIEISFILTMPQAGPTQCSCQKEELKLLGMPGIARLIFDTATQHIILEDHKPERILLPTNYIT